MSANAQILSERLFGDDPIYRRAVDHPEWFTGPADFVFGNDELPDPAVVFPRVRWGGQYVYASRHQRQVVAAAGRFRAHGWEIEHEPARLDLGQPRHWWWPAGRQRAHYFVARKVLLVPPGQYSDRFTYSVRLCRAGAAKEWVVCKETPTLESVVDRLAQRHPEVAREVIEKRSRKFSDKIFPTFLTREAGILQILQRDLPEPWFQRVPRVVGVEKDERGFVRRLYQNWLRNGGAPLSLLEFAEQSARLLSAVHDESRVMHLDLRLDNMVITPDGVGFVDFGSSVREGEDLSANPMLASLYDELMRTSQIQVMLERLTLAGHVTSETLKGAYRKADKALDFFYLAVQFVTPHANPDLAPLIQYDKGSEEARALSDLTTRILRPLEPANPEFQSAADILRGVRAIRERLGR